ncbi:MAG: histone deacetylase [Thermodesulfobacteriota bacterium]
MKPGVGIVRDDRFLEHETGLIHPENPNRLLAIHRMLDAEFTSGLILLRPEPATIDQIELVHTPAYVEKVLATAEYDFTHLAPDTPASARTYLAAWLAVGGCLQALDALLEGRCSSCFAFIRPPGHHALSDRASGFCVFNNLGVTARQALRKYGLKRILIVDWDVHHGNGLQQMFYEEKEVLYFSSHYLGSFPQTGDWEEAGAGPGLGYTVNLPLPKNTRDEDILHCYREIVGPIVRRYHPQLILVAAGFDAHVNDPLSRTSLTANGFGRLTRLLLDLAAEIDPSPLLLALEGGYDTLSLVESIREVLKALIQAEPGTKVPPSDTTLGQALVSRAVEVHARYGVWVGGDS